jgi:ribosomal protein S18 acetylase RimI-like enzyme
MTLTFRQAMPAERDEVERVIRAAFTPYVRALGREISAQGFARLPGELERGDIHLALEADQIVGVIRTERQEGGLYIDQIAVDPVRQGGGVGSWLLQRVEDIARSRGLRGLSLYTAEMAEANIRLYLRHGFEIVSRGPPEHGLDPHTRVRMVKSF